MLPGGRLLRHAGFRNLFWGQVVSQLGDAFYFLVFMFVIDRETKSPLFVGIVMAAQALPYLLLAPAAGVAADRFDRRRILFGLDMAAAALMGGLAVAMALGFAPAPIFLACFAFVLACLNVFFAPARSAAIPRLVPAEEFQEAQGLLLATQQLTMLIGVGLSAGVLGVVERVSGSNFLLYAVVINALSFGVSSMFLSRLPSIVPERESHEEKPKFIEGWQAIQADPFMRIGLPMLTLMNLVFAGFYPVYLETNRSWFGGQFYTVAIIEFAFFGMSMLCSLWVAKRAVQRVGLAFVVGLAGTGLSVAAMAGGQVYLVYVLLNMVCGLFLPWVTIPINTYIGLAFPDAVRGRVAAVLGATQVGIQPLGMLGVSAVLAAVGLQNVYLVIGLVCAIPALLMLLSGPFRASRMPTPAQDALNAPEPEAPA
jgi:MFS family permease